MAVVGEAPRRGEVYLVGPDELNLHLDTFTSGHPPRPAALRTLRFHRAVPERRRLFPWSYPGLILV